MALRRWQTPDNGAIVLEGIQTGDGRVWADGAFTWAPFPLPLAWMVDGTQHVDLSEMAPEIGTIEDAARADNGRITAWGYLDDEIPQAAELIRRMEAGTANHGHQAFVSVDPDNWSIEVILTDASEGEDEMMFASARPILALSGKGRFPTRDDVVKMLGAMTAAAGDPDPGPGGGENGMVLFSDTVDAILLRFTTSRLRGTTVVATPAFDGAFIELAPVEAQTASGGSGVLEVLTARSGPALRSPVVLVPDRLTVDDFAAPGEPDGSLNIDDYRVSGYVALWDSCHEGYTDRCVPPPREDASYGTFRHGQGRQLDDDSFMSTGVLTWGIPHADLDADQLAAFSHYADARHGFSDVVAGANEWGIWHAGALRGPSAISDGITHDDVRVLRCLSLSGDWRYDQRAKGLRMIAALAVNHPGFPVPRLVASAGSMASDAARRAGHVIGMPDSHAEDGVIVALVAAGMTHPAQLEGRPFTATLSTTAACSCHSGESQLDRIESMVKVLDARTKHLVPVAASASLDRIRALS